MGVLGGFIQEQILHYHAFHRRQCCRDMLGIRIGLNDIFAFAIQPKETAIERGFKHVGNAQTRFWIERHAPGLFKLGADGGIGNMPIARQFMRE